MNDNYFRFPRPESIQFPDIHPVQWRTGTIYVAKWDFPPISEELQAAINEAVRNHYAAMERAMLTVAQETAPGITRDSLLEQLRGLAEKYPAIDPIERVCAHPDNTWLAQNMLRQAGVDDRSIYLDFSKPPKLEGEEEEPEQPVEPPQAADAETVDDFIANENSTSLESLERLQSGVTVAVREWMPRDAMLCVTRSGAYQWIVNVGKGEKE
jgi:hypothetical protein